MTIENKKPHAICIPNPFQSHIKAILKFSKLLYHSGFHITFVNTEFNQNRFLKSRGLDSLNGSIDFRFVTIPDGLPPSDANSSQDVPALCGSIRKNFLAPFRDLVAKIIDSADENIPPVTCIISDGVMPFTVSVGEEFGIPVVLVWTFSACGFLGLSQFPTLIEKGLTPAQDMSYYTDDVLNTKIDWISSMKNMRMRDLPTNYQITDPEDPVFNLVLDSVKAAPKGSALVIHTYDELEKDCLDEISSKISPLYTIGPFELLLNQIHDPLTSIGYNLWEEETECLKWLKSKEPDSVVYVNFGSVAVLTRKQLLEFGWGLANSKYSFLWIIRPDLVIGESAALPPEFVTETKERGMIASWCAQEAVLKHTSVGGFLTHCGWGSTIESLSAGVPMLCWPFFADQQTNSKYICNEWEVGMEIDSNTNRDDVEKLVRELMDGEKGKKMKKKASEWKSMADEATSPNGSSFKNLEKLVNQLLNRK